LNKNQVDVPSRDGSLDQMNWEADEELSEQMKRHCADEAWFALQIFKRLREEKQQWDPRGQNSLLFHDNEWSRFRSCTDLTPEERKGKGRCPRGKAEFQKGGCDYFRNGRPLALRDYYECGGGGLGFSSKGGKDKKNSNQGGMGAVMELPHSKDPGRGGKDLPYTKVVAAAKTRSTPGVEAADPFRGKNWGSISCSSPSVGKGRLQPSSVGSNISDKPVAPARSGIY
jgi:hypothetical protein